LFHGYCSLRVDLTQGAGHGGLMTAGRSLRGFYLYGADQGASAMTAKRQKRQFGTRTASAESSLARPRTSSRFDPQAAGTANPQWSLDRIQ
jgi:hypothetical protein